VVAGIKIWKHISSGENIKLMIPKFLMPLVVLVSLVSCEKLNRLSDERSRMKQEIETEKYNLELRIWDIKRKENLMGPTGWVNVRGLFWLKNGINSFGSGKENDIVFPEGKIGEKAGFFVLRDSIVSMQLLPTIEVTSKGKPVSSGQIYPPDSSKAKTFEVGSLQWFVIKRGDKIGVRLRDFDTEKLKAFEGIERFAPDLKWRVKATLTVQPGKTIEMFNVLGQTSQNPVKGTLTFEIGGQTYSLDAIDEDGKLFIIFGDATNGSETYGSGRYLYAAVPETGDVVDLDFNHAINPPCAFTEFATCLLPPKQNVLPIKVEAGEKDYHH
jgi:uncharacterized protein (DUF1684 family)